MFDGEGMTQTSEAITAARNHLAQVKTGLPGVAHVKLDPEAPWPRWRSDCDARAEATPNSCLELLMHRVDLRDSLLRYGVWAIPTVGFIGTLVGIALALVAIDPQAVEVSCSGD